MASGRTLVVLGSGPGIGVSVASLWAKNGFEKVALLARDSARLKIDSRTVSEAAGAVGKFVEVQTWSVDLTNTKALNIILEEVQLFGQIDCVLFNATAVRKSKLLEEPEEIIEQDFRLSNIALYNTARWAIPLLLKASDTTRLSLPALLVTSGGVSKDPVPQKFVLSMVKAAQRSLTISLAKSYQEEDIHIGLITVGGAVDPSYPRLNPTFIAEQTWDFFCQKKSERTLEVEILA
ncbi:putative NADP(+)-dependent dehydrogenase [Stipitochalara longipes BDJ]|nr:putative NADP(+)-dependent dehydrogenase [Stipitochalara longipes BDJ]